MAIEALRQVRESAGLSFEGVKLRDVDIKTALVVPDNDDGVETVVHLQKSTNTETAHDWHTFSMESLTDEGNWTVHCEGRISSSPKPTTQTSKEEIPVDESILTQRVPGKRWYDAFNRVGFYYGKTFQQLQQARTDRSVHHATGDVTVLEKSGIMAGESRYLVHPTTIDACLQLIIISIHAGKHKEMPWGVVPTRIEEMTLFAAELDSCADASGSDSATGHAVAWTNGFDGRRFNTNVQLNGADDRLLLDIKNLTCVTYEAALPAGGVGNDGEGAESGGLSPFSIVKWKPDIEMLHEDDFAKLWPAISTPSERLAKCIELIDHRQVVRTALIITRAPTLPDQVLVDAILDVLPRSAAVTVGFVTEGEDQEQEISLSERAEARVSQVILGTAPESWLNKSSGPYDLVLANLHFGEEDTDPDAVLALIEEGGWLLGSSTKPISSPLRGPIFTLQIGDQFASLISPGKIGFDNAGPHATEADGITVLLAREGANWYDLPNILSAVGGRYEVREKLIKDFHPDKDRLVVIDDTAGAISASMVADPISFESMKVVLTSGVRVVWVTRGTRQGRAAAATAVRMGMAEGLLRVLRSEQAASKMVLLDFDLNEETHTVGAAVISRLEAADTKDSGHDTEFWLHRGVLQISRVYTHESIGNESNQGQPQEKPLDGLLRLSSTTADGQLIFEDEGQQPSVIANDEVELHVLASQPPSISRGSQLLVGGIIARAGSTENQSLVGEGAIAFVYDGFQTVLQTSAYAVIDETESEWASPEALVGILPSLCPIVQLCLINAKLEKDDCVLSLPGPKTDVYMLARLARVLGWNITVVARSTVEKEQFISQIGLSPDQVLLLDEISTLLAFVRKQQEMSSSGSVTIIAHDFDSLSQEVWRDIPSSCRLLLSNKSSLEVVPDPLPFSRGASFVSSNMKSLHASPKAISKLLKLSLDQLKTHPSLLGDDIFDEIDVVDVQDVRDTIAQIDEPNEKATVVRYRQGESRIKVSLQHAVLFNTARNAVESNVRTLN